MRAIVAPGAFEERVEHERDRLRALSAYLGAIEERDERLAGRLRPVVEDEIAPCTTLLDRCAASGEGRWALLDTARRQVDDVTTRGQRMLAGALARSLELDGGQCRVADRLLDEIAAFGPPPPVWRAVTVPSTSEQFDLNDGCIRVGWGAPDVPKLALTIHELGHAAMTQLSRLAVINGRVTVENPMLERDREIPEGQDVRSSLLAEHWADAYAVYVAGPAPLAAMIEHIFPPARPLEANATHPAAAQRVWVMMGVLQRVDRSDYASVARRWIKERWRALLQGAADADAAADADPDAPSAVVDQIVTQCVDDLTSCLPAAAYSGLPRAFGLAHDLATGDVGAGSDARLVDVVNAAWIARLDPTRKETVESLSRRSLAMAEAACAHV